MNTGVSIDVCIGTPNNLNISLVSKFSLNFFTIIGRQENYLSLVVSLHYKEQEWLINIVLNPEGDISTSANYTIYMYVYCTFKCINISFIHGKSTIYITASQNVS